MDESMYKKFHNDMVAFGTHSSAAAESEVEAKNLTRWRSDGKPAEWIAERRGIWNQDDVRMLLDSLRGSQYWPMVPEKVVEALEYTWQREVVPLWEMPTVSHEPRSMKELGWLSRYRFRRSLARLTNTSAKSGSPRHVEQHQNQRREALSAVASFQVDEATAAITAALLADEEIAPRCKAIWASASIRVTGEMEARLASHTALFRKEGLRALQKRDLSRLPEKQAIRVRMMWLKNRCNELERRLLRSPHSRDPVDVLATYSRFCSMIDLMSLVAAIMHELQNKDPHLDYAERLFHLLSRVAGRQSALKQLMSVLTSNSLVSDFDGRLKVACKFLDHLGADAEAKTLLSKGKALIFDAFARNKSRKVEDFRTIVNTDRARAIEVMEQELITLREKKRKLGGDLMGHEECLLELIDDELLRAKDEKRYLKMLEERLKEAERYRAQRCKNEERERQIRDCHHEWEGNIKNWDDWDKCKKCGYSRPAS